MSLPSLQLSMVPPPSVALFLWLYYLIPTVCSWKVPATPHQGPCEARFTSDSPVMPTVAELDAPRLSCINSTVYDWWSWEVISSTDPRTSFTFFLITMDPSSLPGLIDAGSTVVSVIAWVSDGSEPRSFQTSGHEAEITHTSQASQGIWHGTGVSWERDEKLGTYRVHFRPEGMDIQGECTFQGSSGAPNLPCSSPSVYDPSLSLGPDFGVVMSIPNAPATVDLKVQGQRVAFEGSGYHDRGFSDRSLLETTKYFIQGSTRVGPYSVAWISLTAPSGRVYENAYVARDGVVIQSGCAEGLLDVRVIGDSAVPDGLDVRIAVPGGELWIRATTAHVMIRLGDTVRVGAWMRGELNGEVFEGTGAFEVFVGDGGGAMDTHDEL